MNKRRVIATPDSVGRATRVLSEAGIARSKDLERAGVSRTQLRRLVERGEVERLGRGLYTLAGTQRDERADLAEAARRVPTGVVCLLSALRFHGLTTQDPFEVWMAVSHKAWRPTAAHPPLRLVFLSGRAHDAGVESHHVNGVAVRVFGAAKTVADCFKFRNKIGIDVAIEALHEFRRLHPSALASVGHYARVDRVARVIQPYLDTLP